MRMTMGRRAYPSDLTDEQWELLAPLIPEPSLDGRIPELSRREIVNGILYVLRSGCPWRLVPHDLPAWGTVYWYASHAGETKVSGIKCFKRFVARFASSKAATLSPAPPSSIVNRSKPAQFVVPKRATMSGKKRGVAKDTSSLIPRATYWP